MANALTINEYREIKNKLVDVIFFDGNGKRKDTLPARNYREAVEEIKKQSIHGLLAVIVESEVGRCINIFERSHKRLSGKLNDYHERILDKETVLHSWDLEDDDD